MRILILATSALALTACTSHDMFAPHYTPKTYHQSASHHGGYAHHGYAHNKAQNNHFSGHQGYKVSAPVDVYPTGYQHAAHHPAYHGGVPALRGSQHHARNKAQVYGNLGAIMYDVE